MEISEVERLRGTTREERISPREVDLIKYRDNRTALIVTLLNGEIMEGAVRWYDDHARASGASRPQRSDGVPARRRLLPRPRLTCL